MKPPDVQKRSLDLNTMEPIRIADLEPSIPSQDQRYIKGVVTLIWPFSSSANSAAVLLAEPDFRLRRNKGQVRVQFVGSSGKAIAGSRISSGDEVILGLGGAEWAKGLGTLPTPGKNVDWELCFRRKLSIQIHREGQPLTFLDINEPAPSPEPQLQSPTPPRSKSPVLVGFAPGPVTAADHAKAWPSPAYIERTQVSESQLLRWPYDPFAEEDGYLEGRGRKRTKFWRASGEWRYSERTPSLERIKDGGVAQNAFQPARDVVIGSEVEPGPSGTLAILRGEPPGGNNNAQEQTRQILHADNDVATAEASILGAEEVIVEARKSETASTHDQLGFIAVTTQAAAAVAVNEPEATLKPPASSNWVSQQSAEIVPSDSITGGQPVAHGGWDQAIQQARFEAELFGGDTEENTEYDTSQGVELSSAADDGDTTPKQGPIGPIFFPHPPSLQQVNTSMPSPSKLPTPLRHDQPPLSPRPPPVDSLSLPLVSPCIGPVPARLDRSPPLGDAEEQPSQQGDTKWHSHSDPELDESKQQETSKQKLYHAPPLSKQGKPKPSNPDGVRPDFGLDGAFFSRPGPEDPIPSPDEVNNQPVDHDTEESLISVNQQESGGQNVVTPHPVETMPDAFSPEGLQTAYVGQVAISPAAPKDAGQQWQAEASYANPVWATTLAGEVVFSEGRPPFSPAPAAEDGTPRPHTSPSPPTVITSRLQIGTFDEDPPYVAPGATEILSSNVTVFRGGKVLKHQSLTSFEPINRPGETETTTLHRDQLEPEVIDISSEDGLGSAIEHHAGAAAGLGDEEDGEYAYGEVEENFDDEDVDQTETDEYDEEEYKLEYSEYLRYMSPHESVTETDERSSGGEEEEVRSSNLAEDVHHSDVDEAEAEDRENQLLPLDAPNSKPYHPGKHISQDVDADHTLNEPAIPCTQQLPDAALSSTEAVQAAAEADSLGDTVVQDHDGMSGLGGSPGVDYVTKEAVRAAADADSLGNTVVQDHDGMSGLGGPPGVDYVTKEAVSRQTSPVGIVCQERGLLAGAVTLDNAYAEKNAARDINEGNPGEDSAKRDTLAQEHPQSGDMKALDSLSKGGASGKTYLSGADFPLAAYDSDEIASSERRPGVSHSPSVTEDANNGITAMMPVEIVAGKMDIDLKSRQEQDVQELGEVSRVRLDQEPAGIDSEIMNGLRRLPPGTVSHSPSVQGPDNARIKSEESEVAYVNEPETERSSVSEGYATLSETPSSSFEAPQAGVEIVNAAATPHSPNAPSRVQPLVPSYLISEQIEELDLSQILDPEPYRRFEYRSTISPVRNAGQSAAVSPQSLDRGTPIGREDASYGVGDLVSAVDSLPNSRNETLEVVSVRPPLENPMDIDRLGRSLSPSASAFASSLPKPIYSGQSQGDASLAIKSSGMSSSQRMASSNSRQPQISERDLPVMAEGATPETHELKLSTKEDAELPMGADATRLAGESVASRLAIAAPSPPEKLAKKDELTHSSIQYPSFQQPIDLEKTPRSSPRQTNLSGERDMESSILATSQIIKRETLTSEVSSGVVMLPGAPSSTAFLPMPQISNHATRMDEHEGDQSTATQPETAASVPYDSQSIVAQQQQLQEWGPGTHDHEQAANTLPLPELNTQHENKQVVLVDSFNEPTLSRGTSSRRPSSRRTTFQGSMSILPDVISPWFAPRQSSRLTEKVSTDNNKESVDGDEPAHEHTQRLGPKLSAVASGVPTHTIVEPDRPPSSISDAPIASDHGFRTPLSYYTPLSNLPQHLNTVPSPFGDATIDVLAVVSDTPQPPARAKDGPRDYFTVFHVIDSSVTAMLAHNYPDNKNESAGSSEGFQVMVFRPWKASLPTAAPGDVVLLRNFVVKSIKGRSSLLSAEYSAWCVWRFGEDVAGHGRNRDGDTPAWARRQSQVDHPADQGREECKGPPMEIGSEERGMVQQLRGWWNNLRNRQIRPDGHDESVPVAQGG